MRRLGSYILLEFILEVRLSHLTIGARSPILYNCSGIVAIVKWDSHLTIETRSPIKCNCSGIVAIVKWDPPYLVVDACSFVKHTRSSRGAIVKWQTKKP